MTDTAWIDPDNVIVAGQKVSYAEMRQFMDHVDERRVLSFASNAEVTAASIPATVNTIVVADNTTATIRARAKGINGINDALGASWGVVGSFSNVLTGATGDLNNAFGVRIGGVWPAQTATATVPIEDAFNLSLGYIEP